MYAAAQCPLILEPLSTTRDGGLKCINIDGGAAVWPTDTYPQQAFSPLIFSHHGREQDQTGPQHTSHPVLPPTPLCTRSSLFQTATNSLPSSTSSRVKLTQPSFHQLGPASSTAIVRHATLNGSHTRISLSPKHPRLIRNSDELQCSISRPWRVRKRSPLTRDDARNRH